MKKSGKMTNNHSNNLNGGNMYDLWVINWVVKPEIEFMMAIGKIYHP
jgi:hypothetical protein